MTAWIILAGFILDYIIGDPVYRFHPVRLIGCMALSFEAPLRRLFANQYLAGALAAILTLVISTTLTYLICGVLYKLAAPAGFAICAFIIYSTIACKDMIKHSREIHKQLCEKNLILARAKTAMIVGRDTRNMTEKQIIRGTVESIAENSVDGALAPIFYATIGILLFGPVGGACAAILYRTVNTLDSSFGYRNEKYLEFGLISARLDDILNFIPARLSLLLISMGALFTGLPWRTAFTTGFADHAQHASPNSGYSEAAFAGALGLQFGGSTEYQGETIQRPLLGKTTKEFSISDIKIACRLMFNTVLLSVLLGTIILFFYSY